MKHSQVAGPYSDSASSRLITVTALLRTVAGPTRTTLTRAIERQTGATDAFVDHDRSR